MFSNVFNTIWSNPANRILEKQIQGETVVLAENEGRLCAAKRVGNEFVSLILSGIPIKPNTALDKALTCAHLKGSNLQLVGPQLTVLPRMLGGAPDSFPAELLRNGNVEDLKQWFQQHPEFTELSFPSGYIDTERTIMLAKALPSSQISSLTLFWSEIGTEGVKAIATALPHTRISYLCLSHFEIKLDGIEALCEALPQTQVTTLHLNDVALSNKGLEVIAATLPKTNIFDLNLASTEYGKHSNSFGNEGIIALAAMLPQTRIFILDLDNNSFENEGIIALARVLPQTQIGRLFLRSASIDEVGAQSLLAFLPFSQVSRLDVPRGLIHEQEILFQVATNGARRQKFIETCLMGTLEEVEEQLAQGAYIHARDQNRLGGSTPLHIAVEKNDLNLAILLLKYKATLLPNWDDKTPLDLAYQLKHQELVDLLKGEKPAQDMLDS